MWEILVTIELPHPTPTAGVTAKRLDEYCKSRPLERAAQYMMASQRPPELAPLRERNLDPACTFCGCIFRLGNRVSQSDQALI